MVKTLQPCRCLWLHFSCPFEKSSLTSSDRNSLDRVGSFYDSLDFQEGEAALCSWSISVSVGRAQVSVVAAGGLW